MRTLHKPEKCKVASISLVNRTNPLDRYRERLKGMGRDISPKLSCLARVDPEVSFLDCHVGKASSQ